MTEAEHHAAAALLGGRYGRRSHCYRLPASVAHTSPRFFDADTMEELTPEQWSVRVHAFEPHKRSPVLPPK